MKDNIVNKQEQALIDVLPDTFEEFQKGQEIYDTLADSVLIQGRRRGNTTRQVNLAVELLFETGAVKLLDHHENGENNNANKELYRRTVDRLRAEHPDIMEKIAKKKYDNFWVLKLMRKK